VADYAPREEGSRRRQPRTTQVDKGEISHKSQRLHFVVWRSSVGRRG
jgi:hypothetical protein